MHSIIISGSDMQHGSSPHILQVYFTALRINQNVMSRKGPLKVMWSNSSAYLQQALFSLLCHLHICFVTSGPCQHLLLHRHKAKQG